METSSDDAVMLLRQHAALISVALATVRDRSVVRNVGEASAPANDDDVLMERSTMQGIHDCLLEAADALTRLSDALTEASSDVVTLQRRFARHVQAHRAASPNESVVPRAQPMQLDAATQTEAVARSRSMRSSLPPLRTAELQANIYSLAPVAAANDIGGMAPMLPLHELLASTQPMASPTPHRVEQRQAPITVQTAPVHDTDEDERIITARGALGAITARTMRAVRATRPCLPDPMERSSDAVVVGALKSPHGAETRLRHVTAVPDAATELAPGMQRTFVFVRPLRSNDAMLQYDTHAMSGSAAIDTAATGIEGRLRAAAAARANALQDDGMSANNASIDSGTLDSSSMTPQAAFTIDGVAALLAAAASVKPPQTPRHDAPEQSIVPPPPYPRPVHAVRSTRLQPLDVALDAAGQF